MSNAIKSLINLSPEQFIEMLGNSGSEMIRMVEGLLEPKYSIGQLGIDRNTFVYWLQKGLIPYQTESVDGWRRFSFFECIWLKVILELRGLGLPVEEIGKVKEYLFDPKHFAKILEEKAQNKEMVKILGPRLSEHLPNINALNIEEAMKTHSMPMFHFLVMGTLLRKQGYAICIGKGEAVILVPLGPVKEPINPSQIMQAQQEIWSSSFIVVNIWPLILDLLFLEGLKVKWNLSSQILSEEERQILLAIRSGDYTEITIKMNKSGEATSLNLKKDGITKEALRKLYHFLKKGSYDQVQFKTKDGLLIEYSKTEVVKLKKGKPGESGSL